MAESIMQKIERFRDGIETAKTDKTRLVLQVEALDALLVEKFKTTEALAQEILDKDIATDKRLGLEIVDGKDKAEEKYNWPL